MHSHAAPADGSPVIAAVGDIACAQDPRNNPTVCQYDDVADLALGMGPDAFLVLGDVQYETGALADFMSFYDRYFGALLGLTAPVPGNHEYGTPDAQGYFDYFGDAARPPHGYYSFDLGAWHIIALNSQLCRIGFPNVEGSSCGPGSSMHEWLRRDLERNAGPAAPCTLAYWHHPLFDWLPYSKNNWFPTWDTGPQKPLWELLYAHGADVVLVGHDHNYQRWAPQDPDGRLDPSAGIVQFLVGTGGRSLNSLGHPPRPANLAAAQDFAFGLLKMVLHPRSYDFEWVSAAGQPEFVDAGRGVPCH